MQFVWHVTNVINYFPSERHKFLSKNVVLKLGDNELLLDAINYTINYFITGLFKLGIARF